MSEAMTLLDVPGAIAAAERLRMQAGREIDPRRAVTGTSTVAILSMAILVGQLADIAEAAAAYAARPRDHAVWESLQDKLLAAGFLPLPPTATQEEPAHGEG